MRNAETPRPDDGGPLSTEDLAGGGRQDIDSEPSEFADTPPAYPGEATSGAEEREDGARQEPADEPGASEAAYDPGGRGVADEYGDREAADDSGGMEAGDDPGGTHTAGDNEPLLGAEQEEFRARWQQIQSRFVDDPKDSVNAADQLVAETMQALATTFSSHKRDLEGQWHRGEKVPTEDLRLALQQYRSFFNRLLST
ncbi:hypothetical protein DWB77_00814 [Streptomyces hundungensis]|uniref:Uncharacterized protein n=1 Tax=Streptomyces hundungensis TaxID=1077946 RepID=A0A387H4S8_9ACTN|nr:hypothetical protein [Streptomyces hundungensis]AYG78706.1 hypothetical protein DWB77_00814 [Streptomyces hundungensis]